MLWLRAIRLLLRALYINNVDFGGIAKMLYPFLYFLSKFSKRLSLIKTKVISIKKGLKKLEKCVINNYG